MLNVAPQKERIPDHLRAMAEQDDKSAASGKTGEQSSIGADGREVFHHTRPATARGMVWAHVERRDMVAAFDWKPSTAGRYKVPPAIKRWVTG